MKSYLLYILATAFYCCATSSSSSSQQKEQWMNIINNNSSSSEGRASDDECHWIDNRKCPDPEVRFYLYTHSNVNDGQLIHVNDSWETSNLSTSHFNSQDSTKIIIHGFRSDMFLTPLFKMKTEYLNLSSMNIFYVDWFNLSSSICYPAVVHNIKHVGECTAQLVRRIMDVGNDDIHIIGFSLGAQLTNYIAESLKPDIILPRISGIDAAMPWFIMADDKHELDKSDARFVDVYHCNSLMQAKLEAYGDVDFYFNNAIIQPGCDENFIACSHQRCVEYFMESIRSTVGFYGQQCQSYLQYILGLCRTERDTLAGEHCDETTTVNGMYFIRTNSKFPFAKGRLNYADRSMSNDLNNFEFNLRGICNGDDAGIDESFKKFLNCKRFEPKVIIIEN